MSSLSAGAILRPEGGHVISTDEKTGIQALERAAPTLPMKPGVVERPEYAYIRHGTQCLIAHFNVVTGEVVAPSIGATRTEEDCAAPIPTVCPSVASRNLLLYQLLPMSIAFPLNLSHKLSDLFLI